MQEPNTVPSHISMNWKQELAKLEFGIIRIESLPDIAGEALLTGLDTPNLRILAGLRKEETSEIRDYLDSTLRDLGIKKPTQEESAWIMVRYFIDRIICGQVDPHEGIHTMIWSIYHAMDWSERGEVYVGDSIGIQELYGLCDTFDEISAATHRWDTKKTNDELLEQLRREIRDAAREYRDGYLAQRINRADS